MSICQGRLFSAISPYGRSWIIILSIMRCEYPAASGTDSKAASEARDEYYTALAYKRPMVEGCSRRSAPAGAKPQKSLGTAVRQVMRQAFGVHRAFLPPAFQGLYKPGRRINSPVER